MVKGDDIEELNEGELDSYRDQYEFFDEWLDRDPEIEHMSLEDFDQSMRIEYYGYTDED